MAARVEARRVTPEFDLAEDNNNPVETERILAVFYRQSKVQVKELAPPPPPKPKARGRWILSERIIVPDITGAMAQQPNGDLIGLIGSEIQRSSDGGRTWRMLLGAKLPADYPVSALGVLASGRWLAAQLVHGGVGNEPEHWGKTITMGVIGG